MNQAPRKYKHVLRYVYALTAIVIIAAAALIIALYTSHHAADEARDRVAFYHMASSAVLQALNRDAQQLNRLLRAESRAVETATVSHGIAERTGSGVSGSLYLMRADVMRLRELQEQYAGDEFISTFDRLTARFGTIERLFAEAEPTDAILDTIGAFELKIQQLYRLHLMAASNTLAGNRIRASQNLPNLSILAAILAVAVVVGWYVTRLLRESLVHRARTEQALAASQERMHHLQKLEALGQLVGGVAHDFNNLLTTILGQSELLAAESSGDESMQESVSEIAWAAQQAASLTQQLLAFSRRQPIQTKAVDLNKLVLDMEPMLRRLIGEDIELKFDYNEIRDAVELDPGQMRQVILNLFINARDAIVHDGKISLASEQLQAGSADDVPGYLPSGRYARLVVTDNGAGMDKETCDRAFEPFFTTKPQGRGTGLGLAMAHGIITAADGHIYVTSQPGHGSRFEIYLPVSASRPEEPAAELAPAPGGSETVLVVEDEEQIRTFLQTGLGSLGYKVLTASGGSEGLEICKREPGGIDVIVSDVVMPDMNGADFMKSALPMQPHAAAIFMSGYTDDIVLRRGVDGLAIPLLQKPFKLDALAKLIRKRLKQKYQPAI